MPAEGKNLGYKVSPRVGIPCTSPLDPLETSLILLTLMLTFYGLVECNLQ